MGNNMRDTNLFYAVVEAGGTKFNCAIVDAKRHIHAQARINTTTPGETIAQAIDFFQHQRQLGYHFKQLGLACFGPLDLNRASNTFGFITATPKPQWSNTPIVGLFEQGLSCKVMIDTDVNAAALAEYLWGASQHTNVSIYVTVGTGVGGGVIINGVPLHGLVHPEIGHMLVPPPQGIQGVCPFHGNCVEGLASGFSLSIIWQQKAETLHHDHPAWDIQARVLASMCHNLILGYSAEKIVLGGGVMAKPDLMDKIIAYTEQSLANYVAFPKGRNVQQLLCSPGLGEHSGLFGALALVLSHPS